MADISKIITLDGTEYNLKDSSARNSINTKANISDVYTKSEIDNKLYSVFRPGGSVRFEQLPALTNTNLGKIINVTNDFITTNDFVEGEGYEYPAGTNVAIVDIGTESLHIYKYDIEGSFFDLSNYVKQSDLNLITTAQIDEIFN